jgi:hypothetical protein
MASSCEVRYAVMVHRADGLVYLTVVGTNEGASFGPRAFQGTAWPIFSGEKVRSGDLVLAALANEDYMQRSAHRLIIGRHTDEAIVEDARRLADALNQPEIATTVASLLG